jgi:uncharacterized protein YeaO (DUF488 family)
MGVKIKRVYDPPSSSDGYRVLVDRLWPRGLSKASLTVRAASNGGTPVRDGKLDVWMKEIAPSNELRQRFHHNQNEWEEFQKLYFRELDDHSDLVEQLIQKADTGTLTLLFAAQDEVHTNAVALRNYLERKSH